MDFFAQQEQARRRTRFWGVYVLQPLIPDCLVLLSALARLGQDDPAAAALECPLPPFLDLEAGCPYPAS